MKDANGNYYIDPNRQLKGTDIQEMRAKDADVSPYMKSDEFEVTIGNLREYQE